MGRLSLVMVAGVLLAQLAGNLIWANQLRTQATADVTVAAQYLGHGAANTIRYFRSVPAGYRPLLIEQLREMGGTRFFVNLDHGAVPVQPIAPEKLADTAARVVERTLRADIGSLPGLRLAFAWPDRLVISSDGLKVTELPDLWVQHILLVQPAPAPVLVIQTELEPGNWLLLATLMPDPYFISNANPLTFDRLLVQGVTLAAVLVLSILFVLHWITRPLAKLSDAAAAIGQGEQVPDLPETGSREFITTARAFRAMRERIARYLEDRERLFVSISHDLRTPITRLKLRSELLDDDALRAEFEEDLDDLDMMVKGALQRVKDSHIHENETEVKLDSLIGRLVRGARLAGRDVVYADTGLTVRAKPLALKRAIGNLLDNALYYGERAEIGVRRDGDQIEILIRDHGPGVPEEALSSLFDPHVRLAHGRERNEGGMGLGLGIARSLVQAQGGELMLANHPDGGLIARIRLQARTPVGDSASFRKLA